MTTLCASVADSPFRSCAASDPGVVTAPGVGEIVVEDADAAVLENDLHEGVPAEHGGVLLLHHSARAPVRVAQVYDPVAHLQVNTPCLFHAGPLRAVTSLSHLVLPEVLLGKILQKLLELFRFFLVQFVDLLGEVDVAGFLDHLLVDEDGAVDPGPGR